MSEDYQNWQVSGTPTHVNPGTSTAYFTFPVTLLDSGGQGTTNFTNDEALIIGLVNGISGFSGFSGYSGYSGLGLSGYSGESGYSGFSGFSGYSGFSGINGATGASGLSGFSGFSGATGATGTSGFSGFSGATGATGASGVSGFSGINGATGATGTSGFSGFSGFSGATGTSGFSGRSGFSGTNGTNGATGTSGFSGFSGRSGFSGATGPAGPSTTINAVNSTAATNFFIVGVAATGSNQTATGSSTNQVFFTPSTGVLTAVSMTASSDERDKTNWVQVEPNFIEKLADVKNGVFTRISTNHKEVGVSAQSLISALKEAVVSDNDGKLAVNYGGAALVAVIELAKEVIKLQKEISELSKKL